MRILRARDALLAVALLAAPAAAQDPQARFESGEVLYGLTELGDTGLPLWKQLFARGWPTDAAHRQLTLGTAQVTFERGIEAYLASGNGGVPLSATAYEAARFQRHQQAQGNAAGPDRLLRTELTVYKNLSGAADLSVPPNFDPVAIPYQRARAELERAWVGNDLAAWRWKDSQQTRHTLDALGFAMLAEVRFARQQLSVRREELQAGAKASFWGRTANEGFFAFIALHSAIAKLHELRRLVLDHNQGALGIRAQLKDLNEMAFSFPSAWTTTIQGGAAAHALDNGPLKLKSELRGQAALLLGLAELAALCDPDGSSKELKDLFAEKAVPGGTQALFEKDTFDKTVETALFVFKSLRTLHVDLSSGRASSIADPQGRGATITPTDLGLFLLAVQAFKDQVKVGAVRGAASPYAAALADEAKKADILVRTLGDSLVAWEQGGGVGGIADVYTIANDARQGPGRSLASQAFAIRGLLVTHEVAAQGGERTRFLDSAERIARFMDRDLWDAASGAYVDKAGGASKAVCLGGIAVVSALRELSLATSDGRYLSRMRLHLETLTRCGLLRVEGGTLAPGLSAEVPITPK